jgi:hypothetical protein
MLDIVKPTKALHEYLHLMRASAEVSLQDKMYHLDHKQSLQIPAR